MNGFTDIGRGTLGAASGAGNKVKPLVSCLLACSSGNALWVVVVAEKEADWGKMDEEVETNALDSSEVTHLKGLLGDRAGCEVVVEELKGLGKLAKVWVLGSVTTGELAGGVELEDILLPNRVLYCGAPVEGAVLGDVFSENTLSSCDRGAYLSWEGGVGLEGGAALRAACC